MIKTLYEPFQHWSDKGSVYILSDPHFGDSDCKLMDPDWITPKEQVAIINAAVMKNDTFLCLGDVGNPEYVKQIKARKKILLLGNHDKRRKYVDLFDEIFTGPLNQGWRQKLSIVMLQRNLMLIKIIPIFVGTNRYR